MRVALVDLLFSWPPHGGADVDLYHVAEELQRLGFELRVFVTHDAESWERGKIAPEELPFPAVRLDFKRGEFTRKHVTERLAEQVAMFAPDLVVVTDGFFMRTYVALALGQYPLVMRFYAYEMACHRDILRFKDGAPCPEHYLLRPEVCRNCALAYLGPDIRRGLDTAWIQEYRAAQAYAPGYWNDFREALESLSGAIVTNGQMAACLTDWVANVAVIPHGVDCARFAHQAPLAGSEKQAIFMSGRAEDPAKGLSVLLEAGERLGRARADFVVRATVPEDTPGPYWFEPVGWQDHLDLQRQYAKASVCVVPSLWEEPFGIVALEAMAVGRPVCASRVGGLQEIVQHNHTGLLFERGDAGALAECLSALLDNAELRHQMGNAGRKRVESEYAWPVVVARYYPAFLKSCSSNVRRESRRGCV